MRFTLLLALVSMIWSCEDDNPQYALDLPGRWEVVNAFRDQAVTESLRGLFFDFQKEGKLITNLSGTEEEYTYELTEEQLLQRDGPISADYTIEQLTADTLILQTVLRKKHFRLIMEKEAAAPTPVVE